MPSAGICETSCGAIALARPTAKGAGTSSGAAGVWVTGIEIWNLYSSMSYWLTVSTNFAVTGACKVSLHSSMSLCSVPKGNFSGITPEKLTSVLPPIEAPQQLSNSLFSGVNAYCASDTLSCSPVSVRVVVAVVLKMLAPASLASCCSMASALDWVTRTCSMGTFSSYGLVGSATTLLVLSSLGRTPVT